MKFSLRKRIKSFGYAFSGLKVLLQEEHNSRIHLLAAVVVFAAGLYFNLTVGEWVAIVLAVALVFICEIFNTVVENICNFISPEKHLAIKRIKDLSAAAVLISALAAVVVGVLVFWGRFF